MRGIEWGERMNGFSTGEGGFLKIVVGETKISKGAVLGIGHRGIIASCEPEEAEANE
jgi:hypothetical protein